MLRWILAIGLLAAVPTPAQEPAKPDATAAMLELDWLPADLAAFQKALAKAREVEVPELDLLLPQVEAGLLFGDLETLRAVLPKAEAAREELAKRKAGRTAGEEVRRTLKLAKALLEFAEKRPNEIGRRTEIFRSRIIAQDTLECVRLVDAATDQLAIEKDLPEGTEATWEQIRVYLKKGTRLHATGATVFGDKFGPFKVGGTPKIPRGTWEKLKDFVPPEFWEPYAPEEKK